MKGTSLGLLAVIGAALVAAAYFLTRRPVSMSGAAPVTPRPGAPSPASNGLAQQLAAGADLVSAIGGLFSGGSNSAVTDGASGIAY